ncbi:MAG: hypothetical protein R3B47_16770 [Bacteroidia bacterium]
MPGPLLSTHHQQHPQQLTPYYQFGDPTASSFRCFNNGVAGANNPDAARSCYRCALYGLCRSGKHHHDGICV